MGSTARIVMLGTGDFAAPTFQALCETLDFHVAALVTQPDRPQGRKQELIPSRIKCDALARGVPVLQPEVVNSPESVAALRASSGTRQLRLTLHGDRGWLAAFPRVTVASDLSDELRLALPTGVDPLEILDAARRAGPVTDFGLDLPTLSELFLLAAGGAGEVGAA